MPKMQAYRLQDVNTYGADPDTPVIVEVKPWYSDVMVWVNIAVGAVFFLEQFVQLSVVGFFVQNPEAVAAINGWILGVVAILNILLRLFNAKQPLTLKSRN